MPKKPKLSAQWVSWLFGIGLLVAVVMFSTHYGEQVAFAQLLSQARPGWLIVGLVLQLGTYLADSLIWQQVLARADIRKPFYSFVGLGLARLFMDQAVPSLGVSGTLLAVKSFDRRGIPRGASMAAVVISLVSFNAAYVLALAIALIIAWIDGELTLLMIVPAIVFAPIAGIVPLTLLWVSRGRTLPHWLAKLPVITPALQSLHEATPELAHSWQLIAQALCFQLLIYVLDAGTLWVMLLALGLSVNPVSVFASFMLSTLARTLGVVPGGLGVFEAVSVATLKLIGVPASAGLAATLLFRFLSFWLPMAPGLLLARREAKSA